MSGLICRKSMTRCLTPGMCSPHGGCRDDAAANGTELQNLRADNAQLVYALKQQEQSYLVLRAELDQLKAENEEDAKDFLVFGVVMMSQNDKIEKLKAENEALRKDAERYRWLLQNWFTMSSEYMGGVSFQTGRSRWSDLPDEAVSEAIDAALGRGEQS